MAYRQQGSVDTVELNEITNVKGDADMAFGGVPGGTDAVIPFNQGVQYLANAARLKAESDQFKYLQFQQNLKDFYTRFDDIKVDGLMEADYPVINEEYAALAKDIASNYDVIRNPNKDPEKFAQLKEREAQLRGRISRSKQDVAFRDAHQKFISSNPNFNTTTNKARIEEFNSKPIGERKLYQLDTPYSYDPTLRAKAANEAAMTKLKEEKTNGKYFTTTEEEQYLAEAYDEAWKATGVALDTSGRPIIEAAADTYSKLYGKDWAQRVPDLDLEIGRSLRKQGSTSTTMQADPYGLQNDAQAAEAALQAKRLAAQKELAGGDALKGFGRLYAETFTNAYTTGYVDPALAQVTWGNNDEIEITETTGGVQDTMTGKIEPKVERKVKVPKITATTGGLDSDGNLIIKRYDNENKKQLPDITVSQEQGRQALYNIAGKQNAKGVAAETERYLLENKLGRNVDLKILRPHFKLQNNPDDNLTDFQYFQKYKKARPKTQ